MFDRFMDWTFDHPVITFGSAIVVIFCVMFFVVRSAEKDCAAEGGHLVTSTAMVTINGQVGTMTSYNCVKP